MKKEWKRIKAKALLLSSALAFYAQANPNARFQPNKWSQTVIFIKYNKLTTIDQS